MPVVTVDLVSDVVCPWCYIGKRRLEAAQAMAPDIEFLVRWRPFQLDGTIPPEGLPRETYLLRKFGTPERVAEIFERVTAVGAEAGIPLAFDRITVSPNTLDAHRIIHWAAADGLQDAVVERLFRLYFVDGGNLADREVLSTAAGEAGMDAAEVRARLATDEDRQTVLGAVDAAHRIGVSGVPFFIFEGRLGVSGAQAPETLVAAARQALETA